MGDAVEIGRRVGAARGYARLTRVELAGRISLSAKQLKRIEDGGRAHTTVAELHTIAQACGVPRGFMDGGFAGDSGLHERMQVVFTALMTNTTNEVLKAAEQLGIDIEPVTEGAVDP